MSHSDESPLSDEQLLALARAHPGSPKSRSAASLLLERYQDRVYQWCYRYTHDRDEALDLAQEALLRAYRKLESFQGRAQFSSWLFVVTRNACLNAIQRVTLRSDPEFDLEELNDPAPDPHTRLERADTNEAMVRVMGEVLDPVEQEAMMLRYFEYLSPDEITRILRIQTRSGARGVLQRARRKLMAAIARRGGGIHGEVHDEES